MTRAASYIRKYSRADVISFRSTKERFGGLSNMASSFPLVVNGVTIRTSEALYQACRFPNLPDVQRMIIEEKSPMTAKMLSKPYRTQSRPDWPSVRVKIMRWCLRLKLAQNWKTFGELLYASGDQPIVEDSSKDDFWGAKKNEEGQLVGQNILGRLLMELREHLRSPKGNELRTVPLPGINDFLLYGHPVMYKEISDCPFPEERMEIQETTETRTEHNTLQPITTKPSEPKSPEQVLSTANKWTGEIPPQKWMDFHANVLSKFASCCGLKLKLAFHISPNGDLSKQKIEEIKSALRELGLNDDITSD